MEENKTLYYKIIMYLKDKIESGELSPLQKLPTEAELSALFNVSRITSKKALEELQKQKLIYRKRGSGSYVAPKEDSLNSINISGKEANIISLVIPLESTNLRLLEIIRGASDFASSKGCYLTVHNTWNAAYKERSFIQRLFTQGIRGIIYYPTESSSNLDLLYYLSLKNYPMVIIDKYFEDIPISYVTSNNFDGAHKATSYLIKLGHINIAYISYSNLAYVSSLRQRYFGYCKAMIDNGLDLKEGPVVLGFGLNSNSIHLHNDYESKVNYESRLNAVIKETLLNLIGKGVTAIHTENDNLALNILNICGECGIKVPQQLSIVGFDNLIMSGSISIPLTTIEQNYYEIGSRAAEIITSKFKDNNTKQYKELVPVTLVERKSCDVKTYI